MNSLPNIGRSLYFHPLVRWSFVGFGCYIFQVTLLIFMVSSFSVNSSILNIFAWSISACINFLLSHHFTWYQRKSKFVNIELYIKRIMRFVCMIAITIAINTAVFLIVDIWTHYAIASLCGMVIGAIFNYFISSRWVFIQRVKE